MAVKELAETLVVGAVLTVLVAATMFMIVELLQRTSWRKGATNAAMALGFLYSRRQLLANAAIAASRVGS
jgi:hypothetical protein